ncbi:11555_t:CDS:1, partial [Dentiscutata heterogama]
NTIRFVDVPKMFNEIFVAWTASLKFIQKAKKYFKRNCEFVKDIVEFNSTKEFGKIKQACEQNFQAYL